MTFNAVERYVSLFNVTNATVVGYVNHRDVNETNGILNNYSVTFDVEAYVIDKIGEKRGSFSSVISLTLVYSIIYITGLLGNALTCIVIARNSHMHTATNLYLFSLAISDVLTLFLGLPPELYSVWEAYPWRFGEAFCIFKSYITEMTSYASVLTITAFTVERYVAICYPIKAQLLSRPSRALKVILFVWVFSCAIALPYPVHTRLFYILTVPNTTEEITDTLICNIDPDWQSGMWAMFQISFFVFFVTPMTMITAMYILIGRTLGATRLPLTAKNNNRSASNQARRAIIRMLVAVVIAFFLCWAPFHAQRLMTSWIPVEQFDENMVAIQSYLFYISGVLYFVSSTVNPILYNLMSRKYRNAFKRTLCRCCYTDEQFAELMGRSQFLSDKSTNYTLFASMKRLSRDASSAVSLHSNGVHSRYASTAVLTNRGKVLCDLTKSGSNRSQSKVSSPLLHASISRINAPVRKSRPSSMSSSSDSGFLVQNALLTTPTRYRHFDEITPDTSFMSSMHQPIDINLLSPSRQRRIKGTYL